MWRRINLVAKIIFILGFVVVLMSIGFFIINFISIGIFLFMNGLVEIWLGRFMINYSNSKINEPQNGTAFLGVIDRKIADSKLSRSDVKILLWGGMGFVFGPIVGVPLIIRNISNKNNNSKKYVFILSNALCIVGILVYLVFMLILVCFYYQMWPFDGTVIH